jgi:hypothetical protein
MPLPSDGALLAEGEDREPAVEAVEAEATWALSLACVTVCFIRSSTSAWYSLFCEWTTLIVTSGY